MGLLFRGIVWFSVYVLLVLLPLALAMLGDPIAAARPWSLEFAVAGGFIAYAIIAFEFALVSRLRAASEPFGTDSLLQFHAQMGVAGMLFLLLHVLLLLPHAASASMFNPFAGGVAARSGALAFWALLILGVTSAGRSRLRLRYETWQWVHASAALLVGGSALVHILAVGHYASRTALRVILIVYALAFVALLLRYRIIRPLRLARLPWEVVSNTDVGGDTRSLV
ncbi:MAG TPA: ferric reductase-like transmembrane domain-containing protein, partial [Steroidobacteraceae bacterium]|nr:ferric reductase-like transmembrane domain-containing protein [Steroidobacteraceae bacterium]